MKAKNYILLIAALLISPWAGLVAQEAKAQNDAFNPGEYLEYRVHYGAVTAGVAKLSIREELVDMHGRKCYHAVGQGISSRAFSTFYRVNDRYETFIDVESLVSHKFKRKIDEGGFRDYTEVEFDQVKHKAYQRKNGQNHVTAFTVPANIQDVLSAFYFARTQDYSSAKAGDIFKFQNFIDQKVFDLDVEFQGRETIKVGGQKYKCVKLKPLVREGGLFRHEGDLFLWISDDENRIPVRIESGLVIGSIQIDLKKAKNLKHPFSAKL